MNTVRYAIGAVFALLGVLTLASAALGLVILAGWLLLALGAALVLTADVARINQPYDREGGG